MSTCIKKEPRELDALIGQYEICNLQAHSAYMQGRDDLASVFYQRAFDLSAEMLTHSRVSRGLIDRCLDASLNCFDYSEAPNDEDKDHYIDVAAERFIDIIVGRSSLDIKVHALAAFADIAYLAYQLMECGESEKTAEVYRQFNKLWPIYSVQLIEPH